MKRITSIKVDEELWKDIKKYCTDKNIRMSDYVESLLLKDKEVRDNATKPTDTPSM